MIMGRAGLSILALNLATFSAISTAATASHGQTTKPLFDWATPNAPDTRFILTHALECAINRRVNGESLKIYHVGESWFEPPSVPYTVSEHASSTRPTDILETFVADATDRSATIVEAR